MRCEDAVLDIGPLLSGALSAEAERRLLEHLASCAACQAEADRMREVWTQLGDVAVERPDSARLRQRLAATIEAYRAGVPPPSAEATYERPAHGERPRRGDHAWVAQLGGVAAALVVGVLVGRESMGRPAAPSAELSALRRELHDTREMMTLALLRQPSASERIRGVNWTVRIDEPGRDVVTALLDALTHDPNVNVRLAAVDALTRYAEQPAVRTGAVAALRDTSSSPLVQVALIDLLVQLKEPASKDALQRVANDAGSDVTVRDRARWALEQMGAL